jgi:hypothetical protein
MHFMLLLWVVVSEQRVSHPLVRGYPHVNGVHLHCPGKSTRTTLIPTTEPPTNSANTGRFV